MPGVAWLCGCGVENHDVGSLGRLWYRLACLLEHGDVRGHGLNHQPLGLRPRLSGGDNSRQVRGVRRVARLVVALKDDYVPRHGRSFRRSACLRMLDSVLACDLTPTRSCLAMGTATRDASEC